MLESTEIVCEPNCKYVYNSVNTYKRKSAYQLQCRRVTNTHIHSLNTHTLAHTCTHISIMLLNKCENQRNCVNTGLSLICLFTFTLATAACNKAEMSICCQENNNASACIAEEEELKTIVARQRLLLLQSK